MQSAVRNLSVALFPHRVRLTAGLDDLLDADSYGIHSLASGDHFRQVVATVYGLYQKKLNMCGALDFGDLLMSTVIALRDNEQLRTKYQEMRTMTTLLRAVSDVI